MFTDLGVAPGRGALLAQLGEHATLDLGVMMLILMLGVEITNNNNKTKNKTLKKKSTFW